jgi:hypothetical protein
VRHWRQRSKVVCPAALVSSKRAAEAIKIGANATEKAIDRSTRRSPHKPRDMAFRHKVLHIRRQQQCLSRKYLLIAQA